MSNRVRSSNRCASTSRQQAPVKPRDVFVYFITEGKVRAPFGAMALMRRIQGQAAPAS